MTIFPSTRALRGSDLALLPDAAPSGCGKTARQCAGPRRTDAIRGHRLRRKSENRSQVIAVRVEPVIEQRLRLLAEITGRSQSFFLKQLIEKGIDEMEDAWLSQEVVAQVRSGALPVQQHGTTLDLFGDQIGDQ